MTMRWFILGLGLWSSLAFAEYKDFVIHLPLVSVANEAVAKIEYNLSGSGALGLELTVIQEGDLYTTEEAAKYNGDSIMTEGQELALTYASYMNASKMSGGYWTLGLGYRQVQADWLRSPSDEYSPTGVSLDRNGKFKHSLLAGGATAHTRLGYRYVASAFPFSIGAFIGVRHYENTFTDRPVDDAVETPDADRESLERRLMSSLEPGIEIGMAF
ncbi:hypothetical protein [Pseudobacteriovorax antillogorgiicola]|uniref:Uncharacterized protein n=1 Tax=Pseudobacteriovorax antillogorgiicola TaxID=1513793 RepID=A0A1Y6B2L5_9BACT|nr:hypothetical protein [Pseudobacteriovorax antillogorgiicola]TCS59447.1 hypothetical protein EDD56_101359 [Pseudobacteriovorax antillogorgiicola]SME88226.1 hypothetical protein SAMN06296036_101126 [Pseudobacteriovorax antillogorgiicola]